MYNFLESKGDRYAALANGVVEANTFSGVAALEFMQHATEQRGVTLTDAKVDAIRQSIARCTKMGSGLYP